MTEKEKFLLLVISATEDQDTRAIVLQNFISECGPLSEEAALEIRKRLKDTTTRY